MENADDATTIIFGGTKDGEMKDDELARIGQERKVMILRKIMSDDHLFTRVSLLASHN